MLNHLPRSPARHALKLKTPLAMFLSSARKAYVDLFDRENTSKARASRWQEMDSSRSESPLEMTSRGALHFSLRNRENHFCSRWYFRTQFIKSDLQIPWPLLTLHPLPSDQRGGCPVLFIKLDMPEYGVQIRLAYGFPNLVLIQGTRQFNKSSTSDIISPGL